MATKPVPDTLLREACDALVEHGGNISAAAESLQLPRGTYKNRLRAARARHIGSVEEQLLAKQGVSPEHDLIHAVPAPFIVRGYSTYYNKDGDPAGQWVKTKLDDTKLQAAITAAVTALAEGIPRAKPVKRPNHVSSHLCNLYTLTDCHVGMHAWGQETGEDWDLDIAERTLKGAFDYLVEATPPAKTGVVLNLGDFLHYDSLTAVTPTNQHPLDADSRYSKMVKVAIRVLRYVIDKALTKHEKVLAVMSEGNHDMASSVWLRHLFGMLYENEPRVQVLNSEKVYTVHQHGKTLLAFHHGHMTKPDQLPGLFAAEYPIEWGSTTLRYCHTGHQHHVYTKEHPGMRVKQHATLAARDAYAARGGWVAMREIEAITYHEKFGQVATVTVTPEMLKLA